MAQTTSKVIFLSLFTFSVLSFQNCGDEGFKSLNSSLNSTSGIPNSNEEELPPTPQLPTPTLGLKVSSVNTKQGLDFVFDVSIKPQTEPVSIILETIDGSALKQVDYVDLKSSFTIPAGQTNKSITIQSIVLSPAIRSKVFSLKATGQMGNIQESTSGSATIRLSADVEKAKQIASGNSHNCMVTPQEKVKCWGNNGYGKLGNNSTVSSPLPVEVVGLSGVKFLSLGMNHSCALTNQNTVKCWGSHGDTYPQNTSPFNSRVPIDIPGAAVAKSLKSGGVTSCVITALDTVKCWDNGEVQEIVGLSGVKSITVGSDQSCAVTSQNTLKCWWNRSKSPSAFDILEPSSVKSVSGGYGRFCMVTSEDTVKCWNSNSTNARIIDVANLSGVKSVHAGQAHVCALTFQGAVKCWGNNDYGQFGNDKASDYSSTPVDVMNLSNVKSLSVGNFHSCALTSEDTVKCWGRNLETEVGNNGSSNLILPADVSSLSGVKSLSFGYDQTCLVTPQGGIMCNGRNFRTAAIADAQAVVAGRYAACALTAQGTVKCWGQSGIYSNYEPLEVSGVTGVKVIALNAFNGCGLTTQGTVKCWDSNLFYRDITGISGAKSLVVGSGHGCALTAQNTVKCWGTNSDGELGNNSTNSSDSPVDVVGLSGVKFLAAGRDHTCVVTSQDTVKCWGGNQVGQLGINSTDPFRSVPVEIPGLSGVKSLAVGEAHTCVLTSENKVMCWGLNSFGQFGNGSVSFSSRVPVEAFSGQKVDSIFAGGQATVFYRNGRLPRASGKLQGAEIIPTGEVLRGGESL